MAHELAKKTFVVMKLKPFAQAMFKSDTEMETYLHLAVKSAEQLAINRGFKKLRLSGSIRMLEDVMVDNGFNTVRRTSIDNTGKFTCNRFKNLK